MSWIDNFDLNDTFTVKRRIKTNDGMGGFTYSTSTIASSQKGALWQNGANRTIYQDRYHNNSAYSLACDPSTGYLAGDRITIGSDTYSITEPDDVLSYDEIMVIGLELVK